MSDLFKHIEWELLQEKIESDCLLSSPKMKPSPDKVEVFRDEQLAIKLNMSRDNVPSRDSEFQVETRRGEIINGEDIEFSVSPVQKLTLHSVIHNGNNRQFKMGGMANVEIHASAHKVSCEFNDNSQCYHTLQYFVGFNESFMMPRGTSRDESISTILDRGLDAKIDGTDASKNYNFSYSGGFGAKNSSRDFLLIKNSEGELLLSQSKTCEKLQNYSPAYLHFCNDTRATGKDYRDSWMEAIGFAFGKRFIQVGHSMYTKEGYPLEKHAYSPYATNFKREVYSPGLPPTFYAEDGMSIVCEKTISKIAELYLKNREELELREVMWKFWVAKAMPLGLNFVCFSAALEKLIDAWYKAQGEKQQTKYVTKKEYKAKFLEPANKTLINESGDWDNVKKRLHIPNELSQTEKRKRFFSNLNLEIGELEKDVMAARNKYAHGDSYFGNDSRRLLNLTRAFEALINRCILKCIGYEGSYYDYSSLDFPLRELDQKLGGQKFS